MVAQLLFSTSCRIVAATSLGLLKLKGMKNDRHSAELTIFLEISIGKTRMIRLEDITTSRFFQLEACSFALLPSISKYITRSFKKDNLMDLEGYA